MQSLYPLLASMQGGTSLECTLKNWIDEEDRNCRAEQQAKNDVEMNGRLRFRYKLQRNVF